MKEKFYTKLNRNIEYCKNDYMFQGYWENLGFENIIKQYKNFSEANFKEWAYRLDECYETEDINYISDMTSSVICEMGELP